MALSVSEGEGTFDQPGVDSGTVESTLTSVNPYVRYRANDRLSVWGLVGYGTGDMTIRGNSPVRTDLMMRLGAAGARGVLLEADEDGGIDLALRGDAFLVQMESEAAANSVETKADASRLRLVLEAGRSFALGEGAVLAPTLELGLRHDGGDAETGTGVEVGGRIRFADAGSGLTVEANARTLVAHEDSDYREWGAGGSVRLDPGASGRGLSLTLAPAWGAASGGADRLWSLRDARAFAANDAFDPAGRLDAEAGYGLGAFGGRGLMTPYAGLALSETGARAWRTGVRWTLGPGVAFGVEGTRSEPVNDDAPEHGLAPSARRCAGEWRSQCAADAAAQAPLGLTAGYQTVCIARSFEGRGSGLGTPFGVWFSHPDHVDDSVETDEVPGVPGVERQAVGGRGRGDEQMSQACSAGPPRRPRGREHAAVCARRLGVERQRLPHGRRPLETVLTPCPFPVVAGGVRAGGELGKRHRGNGGFVRERRRIDDVVVDHHRGIQQPSGRLSHRQTGPRQHPDPRADRRNRRGGRVAPPRQSPLEARTAAAEPRGARPPVSHFG